jgi:ornithine carbamoyltransferase
MGDLQYVRQQRGELKGLHLVFVGEPANLGLSWLEAATVFPIKVTQVCPEGYEVKDDILREPQHNAKEKSRYPTIEDCFEECRCTIYDCWPYAESIRIEIDTSCVSSLPDKIGQS